MCSSTRCCHMSIEMTRRIATSAAPNRRFRNHLEDENSLKITSTNLNNSQWYPTLYIFPKRLRGKNKNKYTLSYRLVSGILSTLKMGKSRIRDSEEYSINFFSHKYKQIRCVTFSIFELTNQERHPLEGNEQGCLYNQRD